MAQNDNNNSSRFGFFRNLFEKKRSSEAEEPTPQEVPKTEEKNMEEQAAKETAATIPVNGGTMLELWQRWTGRHDPLTVSLLGNGHGCDVPLTERELNMERVRLMARIERDAKEFLKAMNRYEEQKARIAAKRAMEISTGRKPPSPEQLAKEKPVDVKTFCRVYLSANGIVAWILLIPPSDPNDLLSKEDVEAALLENKVVYGIHAETVDYIVNEHPYFTLIPVACGTPVQEGENGRVEEHYPRQLQKSVKMDEHGLADYRAMNYVQTINAGDVICDIIPPKLGVSGMRVDGAVAEPAAVKPAIAPAGPNTVLSEDGTQLLAGKSGHLEFDGNKFGIKLILDIPTDVDYSTGNIEYNGDVHIRGDVRSTFSVKATGNITIDGLVEAATIEAGGDVLISCGVLGDGNALLSSGGTLRSKYLENCTAYAGKSIFTDCIISSRVYCDNTIEVLSGRGTIIGGVLVAGHMIKTRTVGTDSGKKTELELGTLTYIQMKHKDEMIELKEALNELTALDRDINFLVKKQKSMESQAQNGGEKEIDPRLPAALLRKNAVCARIDELTQIQQEIEAMKPTPTKCRFECSTVYPPTMLTISGAIWKFDEIKNSCIARLDKESGEIAFS